MSDESDSDLMVNTLNATKLWGWHKSCKRKITKLRGPYKNVAGALQKRCRELANTF